MASTLHKVTEKIYRKRGFASAGVLVNWPAIIGEDWARHTVPERLGASGTLRLRVDGPLATEIKHLEPQILERIASYFGYRAVNRLSMIQGPLEKTQVEKSSTWEIALKNSPQFTPKDTSDDCPSCR